MKPLPLKLYKAINGLGTYWIVATSFDAASNKLMEILNAGEGYGFDSERKINQIHLIAEGVEDPTFIANKFLIL